MARDPDPSKQEWRALYEASASFKALAPWRWMHEDQLFGVVDPEGRETGYCGVTGSEGEHMSLMVNLGSEGLLAYLVTHELGDRLDPLDLMFMQRCLMASYEDRDLLGKEDRDVIRRLGLSFRGRGAWPLFRSFRPGYAPWHLTPWEARFLAVALEQAVDVTSRVREDPRVVAPGPDGSMLFRSPVDAGKGVTWVDERRPPAMPRPPSRATPRLDGDRALRVLTRVPRVAAVWETDIFHIPRGTVERRGDRPYFPRVALWVDHSTGLIIGHSMFGPVESPDLATATIRVIERAGIPRALLVRTPEVASLLGPLAKLAGIEVHRSDELEALEEARFSMIRDLP